MAFDAGSAYGNLELKTGGWEKGISKAMKLLGPAALAGAIGMAGKKAIRMGTDFQKGMAEVNTMLDSTTRKQLPALERGVRDMAMEFGESTDKLQRGLYDILSAGIDAAEAMDVLEVSSKMATAGLVDTAISTDALTTMINSYSLEAGDAMDVSDLLFSVVKEGKTTMDELAPSIGRVASIAASANLSMDEMGASLATMTKSGLQTREAVTGLRSIISTFMKPTEDAAEAARAMGFELNTTTLESIGLSGVLEKLQGATAEQVAEIFSNQRALAGLMPMLQNTSGHMETLATMTGRAGSTTEAFGIMAETSAFKQKQFGAAVNEIWLLLSDKLLPTFTNLVTELIPYVQLLGEGTKNTDELTESTNGLLMTTEDLDKTMVNVITGFNIMRQVGVGVIATFDILGTAIAQSMFQLRQGYNLFMAFHNAKQLRFGQAREYWDKAREGQEVYRESILDLGDLIVDYGDKIRKIGESTETAIDKINEKRQGQRKEEKQGEEKVTEKNKEELDTRGQYNEDYVDGLIAQQERRMAMEEQAMGQSMQREEDFIAFKNELIEEQMELEMERSMEEFEQILERKEKEKELEEQWLEKQEEVFSAAKGLMTDYLNVKQANLKKETNASLSAAEKEYENRKKHIEENIGDEESRRTALLSAEEQYRNREQHIRDESARKEKQLKQKQQTWAVSTAIMNVAQGVSKAIAEGGLLGLVTGAIVAAQGAMQIATIKSQQFAQGADFKVPAGYQHDSFGPMYAQSGERVQITPALETSRSERGDGTPIVLQIERFAPVEIEKLTSENAEETAQLLVDGIDEKLPEVIELIKKMGVGITEYEDLS